MSGNIIKISDDSLWPRPDLENDDRPLSWVLNYGDPTRADLRRASAIISAYGYLVIEANRAKRDLVARDIKRYLRDDA